MDRYTPSAVSNASHIVAIAAGVDQSLALKSDGTVLSWGFNSSGQLGDGTTTGRFTPGAVSSASNIVAISAGFIHSLALTSDGTLLSWGNNLYGQLGDGTTTDRSTPVPVLLGSLTIRLP